MEWKNVQLIPVILNKKFNSYNYTLYRCASKICYLKELLLTKHISHKLFEDILQKHNLHLINDVDSVIYPSKLFSITYDLFLNLQSKNLVTLAHHNFNVQSASDNLGNFLLNMLRLSNHSLSIGFLEFRVLLLILCDLPSLDMFISECFTFFADYNRCITIFRFEYLLQTFSKFLSYIGEKDSYGTHNIPEILEQCFSMCPGINGINEYQFYSLWLSYQNQSSTISSRFLIYGNLFALVVRMNQLEFKIHNVQCKSCANEKIYGIRFKCEVCKKFSLCLKCFASGFQSTKHTIRHRMYETYEDDIRTSKWRWILERICSNCCKTPSSYDLNDNVNKNTFSDNILTIKEKTNGSVFDLDLSSSNRNIIQYIISKIRQEIETLEKFQFSSCDSKPTRDFLESRKISLQNLIENLQVMLKKSTVLNPASSSTPHRGHHNLNDPYLSASLMYHNISKRNSLEMNRTNETTINLNHQQNILNQKRDSLSSKENRWSTMSKNGLQIINEEMTNSLDVEMHKFRQLIDKVKEIIEDSSRDNTELALATQDLEMVLDKIIEEEEIKRIAV